MQSSRHRVERAGGNLARQRQLRRALRFPDGDLLVIDATAGAAERAGFEVRDVENLREHYIRTLRAWTANLAANSGAAIDATDVRTERVWRIYMAGSARGFALGRMGLMQTLLVKPRPDGRSDMPLTRGGLYRGRGLSAEGQQRVFVPINRRLESELA